VMDEMIAANKTAFQAYLVRARYRSQYGTLQTWEEEVTRAAQLAPDEPDVMLARAELAQAHNDLGQSRELLQRALKRVERSALFVTLARVELQAGRPRQAVACLRQAVEKTSEAIELQEALVEALVESGELSEANEVVGRLREQGFPKPALDYLEARILMRKGQWAEAVRLLESARPSLTALPERASRVSLALGECHERLGNTDKAIEAYEQAARDDPRGLAARSARASLLLAAGRISEAIRECRKIASLPQAPGGGLTLLARGLINQNLRLAENER